VTAAVIAGGDASSTRRRPPARLRLREPILLTPASNLAWSTESR
jgi:hypothetical protein